MILKEGEAKDLLSKVLDYSNADSASISLTGSNIYNIRFALNSITTDGFSDGLELTITSNIGKKSGVISTDRFSDEYLKEAVKKSEEIAKLSPDNKEFMLPLPPQSYLKGINYSNKTEELTPYKRANLLSPLIEAAKSKNLNSAGFFQDEVNFYSILNSNGLFAYNNGTLSSLSSTLRTGDGTGSSRFEKQYVDVSDFDMQILTDSVINKSIKSVNPAELSPGRYTVILEPAAVGDLIAYCTYFMDARSADEGRSYFSEKGGRNKIGQLLTDERVNIFSDPVDKNSPSIPFTDDGIPRNKTFWFEKGVLKNLTRGRFWAEKTDQPVVPHYSNILMSGTDKTIDEMISTTESGVLVTRFWYIRTVDQQTMLLTGLTRDGLFEISNGKISRPIKNFRFNESPMNVLQNILEIGKAENAVGSETGDLQIFAPALKVKKFNFSSLSDAI